MHVQHYTVTGMSCGHCEASVREELATIPGILNVEVSAQAGTLAVSAEQAIDHTAIIAAVDEAGYQATPAQ